MAFFKSKVCALIQQPVRVMILTKRNENKNQFH